MSISSPQVSDAMLCSLTVGHAVIGHQIECGSLLPGHSLSPIRERVTAATPSHWRDGIVQATLAGGWIEVALLDSTSTVLLWNHRSLSTVLRIGEPVALHSLYSTLAVGSRRHSVLSSNGLPRR